MKSPLQPPNAAAVCCSPPPPVMEASAAATQCRRCSSLLIGRLLAATNRAQRQLKQQQPYHAAAFASILSAKVCDDQQRKTAAADGSKSTANIQRRHSPPITGISKMMAATADGPFTVRPPISSGTSPLLIACCGGSGQHSRGESSLELEAISAVHQLSTSVAVQSVAVSEMLPRTPDLIFVNLTTSDGQPYCLELTAKGWRVTSLRTDCMQGDFTRMELFTQYYESLHDLMEFISPDYREHFTETLQQRLEQHENERLEQHENERNFHRRSLDGSSGPMSDCSEEDEREEEAEQSSSSNSCAFCQQQRKRPQPNREEEGNESASSLHPQPDQRVGQH